MRTNRIEGALQCLSHLQFIFSDPCTFLLLRQRQARRCFLLCKCGRMLAGIREGGRDRREQVRRSALSYVSCRMSKVKPNTCLGATTCVLLTSSLWRLCTAFNNKIFLFTSTKDRHEICRIRSSCLNEDHHVRPR